MSRHRSRKTSKTPAAQLVASNEDLLSEILLRLPVKSLFRFKCVSTEWTDLISSPYFSKHHTLRNPNSSTTGMILHHHPYLAYISLVSLGPARHVRSSFGPFPALDFLNIPPRFSSLTILGSSHGLLLGLLVASPMLAGDIDVIYIVCNPTTKQFRALPHIADMATRPIVNMDLAHDPSDSPSYKVVCTRSSSPINTTRAFDFQIFTPETGAWRACGRGPFDGIRPGMMFRGGVYSNKRIHFVDTLNEDSLYFDVRDETLKTLKMPSAKGEVVGSKRAWHVGESGGRVHLVDIETNLSRECSIGIYELAEDCSGWAMRWRVGLSAMERGFNEMFVQYVDAVPFLEGVDARVRVGRYYTYNVLGLVRKEDDELELVLSIPNKIVCYNPASGEWRVVVHFSDDRDRRGYDWHNVIRYVDTLAPV